MKQAQPITEPNGRAKRQAGVALPPGEAAAHEIRQYHPQRVLIVALDIGKDVHHIYSRTGAYEEVVAPTKIASLASGYQQVIERIDELLASGNYDLVLLGHEPTGVYHEAWSHALLTHYAAQRTGAATPLVRYRLLNPLLVKQERQRKTHRKRKQDVIDVLAMAELLGQGVGHAVVQLSDAALRLRVLLQGVRTAGRAHVRQGIQLRTALDRLWPGALGDSKAYAKAHPTLPPLLHLVDSRPLERETVRVLLAHCPNPYRLRELRERGIRQLFHDHGASCGPKTAARIYAVAQQSLLPPPLMAELLADGVQADFALYRTYEERIAAAEAQAAALLPQTNGAVLLSFPGLGHALATRYLAALADPTRFTNASQIWSFAGFDPLISETGNSKVQGSISYKGCPYLRATLYQIGFLAAQHCPACQACYQRALNRHPSQTRAIIHVANKANRILFALLRNQQQYSVALAQRV
ncbi:MAG: transposase [Steroidobacteraceae bacterium]